MRNADHHGRKQVDWAAHIDRFGMLLSAVCATRRGSRLEIVEEARLTREESERILALSLSLLASLTEELGISPAMMTGSLHASAALVRSFKNGGL